MSKSKFSWHAGENSNRTYIFFYETVILLIYWVLGQQADVIKTKLYRCYRIGTFGNVRKNQVLPFHRKSQRPQFTFVVKMM